MTLSSIIMRVAIAVAIWQWSLLPGPKPRLFRILGILVITAFVVEAFAAVAFLQGISNNLAYNLFNLLESYLVLALVTTVRKDLRPVAMAAGALVTSAFVANALFNGTVHFLMMEAILFNCFLLSVLIMMVLWTLAQNAEVHLFHMPEFWLFLGLLLYFAGIVPTVGTYRFMQVDLRTGKALYEIVRVLCIIRYLLTAYACWKLRRNSIQWRSA
jgi:hypothetical protein